MYDRCISTEPYATTPLITSDLFRGSTNSSLRLPPNIPVTSNGLLENGDTGTGVKQANSIIGVNDYGGSHTGSFRSHNFNTASDKGEYF